MKKILACLFCLSLTSCSLLSTHQIQQDANQVRLYEEYSVIEECRFIQEIIGTEGHWYNHLFISNKTLIQAAINDLKNQAWALGADTVLLNSNLLFTSSVTLVGQAYSCSNE